MCILVGIMCSFLVLKHNTSAGGGAENWCTFSSLYTCTCTCICVSIAEKFDHYLRKSLSCIPHRSNEIDGVIEQQLADNCGFIDNFSRGTAHMFK